ncbi:MAG: alpha/beta fold hydrolase [Bacteroidales bacterium]
MKNYTTQTNWKEIVRRLPENNRITSEIKPKESFLDLEECKIHIDSYRNPSAEAKIILLHGVGGNGRLLSFIGVPLFKRGYEIIAPDLPGYGYSEVPVTAITFPAWVRLVDFIINNEQEADNRPIFLFGLSAGGMLAYQAAALNKKVSGVIATNILDQRIQYVRDKSSGNLIISRLGKPLLSALARVNPHIRLPMKALANIKAIVNNTEIQKILLKDKTSSGASVPIAFVLSLLTANPVVEPYDFDICPVLLAHPEKDNWTPLELSSIFFNQIKSPKELVILQNAGHFPVEYPGIRQLEDSVVEFVVETINKIPRLISN